jgi:hypothetical protein
MQNDQAGHSPCLRTISQCGRCLPGAHGRRWLSSLSSGLSSVPHASLPNLICCTPGPPSPPHNCGSLATADVSKLAEQHGLDVEDTAEIRLRDWGTRPRRGAVCSEVASLVLSMTVDGDDPPFKASIPTLRTYGVRTIT